MTIREFVINLIQKKYEVTGVEDIDSLNYMESGYIDSMGIIQFIVEIEEEFGIEFTDEEVNSPEFKIVGQLINIIESKVSANE